MAQIKTIGHSTHALQPFLQLLRDEQCSVLVDVRSSPYSRYSPQFNQHSLKTELSRAGIRYLYMGDSLGGRPPSPSLYDEDGHVCYGRIAATPEFKAGIEQLERCAESENEKDRVVVVMCSEEDPTACHRHLLVGRVLVSHGHAVVHVRGEGSSESYEDVEDRRSGSAGQLSLLAQEHQEEAPWRSTRSVLPRNRQSSSSDY